MLRWKAFLPKPFFSSAFLINKVNITSFFSQRCVHILVFFVFQIWFSDNMHHGLAARCQSCMYELTNSTNAS